MIGFASVARAALRAGVIGLGLLSSSPIIASEDVSPQIDPADTTPLVVYTGATSAVQLSGPVDQMRRYVEAKGSVRLIVGLRIVMRMEHTLSASQISKQRQWLSSVQDAVVARVLGTPSAAGVDRYDIIPFMSLFVNSAQYERLLADPQVASIEKDLIMQPALSESIPLIHADDLFAKGFGGTGYVVAVIDSGVAKTHPMLSGKVVSEACYSSTLAPSWTSLCPGGAASSVAVGSGANCPVAVSGCDHGTHVASIAAGNSSQHDGVGRDAKIISIKVATKATTGCGAAASCVAIFSSDVIKALQRVHALRNAFKIASANMSLSVSGTLFAAGCDATTPALTTAMNNVRADGIAPVVASGNNGSSNSITSPACISTAIAVGNSTKTDLVSPTSNHSPLVALMAPGTAIVAAVPAGARCITTLGPHCAKSGTSMAAPHVAGSFALLKNAKPNAAVADILAALKCSGKPIDRRNVAGLPEIAPVLPRIDLIGAFDYLRKPPNVLRIWPFTTLDDAKDWQPIRGKWATSGGSYIQSPVATGWVATTVANCNSKLQVVARIRRVDPSPGPFYYNSGIYIKSQIDYGAETVSGYQFNFNSLPYCLINPPPNPCPAAQKKRGEGNVWKITQQNLDTGNWVSGSKLCQKNVEVTANGFNVIRVDSIGSSHSFYVNNKLVCTISDAAFATGAVTVSAFNPTPATGHSLAIDSVQVKSLETAPAVVADDDAVMDATSFLAKPSYGSTPAFTVANQR